MSNILDSLTSGIMLFVFALVLLVAAFMVNTILGTGLADSVGGASVFQKFFTSLNNVSIFIFLGMSLGAVLSALLIRAHPAFFFISIILVVVQFMIIPPLVNGFNSIASTSMMAVEAAQMANTVSLMQQLPIWTAIACLLAAIVGIGKGEV